eukprot:CAMPEP_0168622310 /NCGR_PEP_ID=MMETSP0449_2-20121227/8195_1 /TAXON_ID=1082188 /ORGANISM="Strombidium rassoulzadegani, Strain ras09" /LENGTH=126 /DNA_ID=CAMNT_0008663559 /DNA_START=394 /DNA_END=774 /DNA_ORIENTATION=-
MGQVHGDHVIDLVAERLVAEHREEDEDGDDSDHHCPHDSVKLVGVFHAGLDVQDYSVSFEVEYSDAEKERHVTGIDVSDVFVSFWVVHVVFFAISHDDSEGKNNGDAGEKGDVRYEAELSKPADGN